MSATSGAQQEPRCTPQDGAQPRSNRQEKLAATLTCSRHRSRTAVFIYEPAVHDVQAEGPAWLAQMDSRPPRQGDPTHPGILVLCADCARDLLAWAYDAGSPA